MMRPVKFSIYYDPQKFSLFYFIYYHIIYI